MILERKRRKVILLKIIVSLFSGFGGLLFVFWVWYMKGSAERAFPWCIRLWLVGNLLDSKTTYYIFRRIPLETFLRREQNKLLCDRIKKGKNFREADAWVFLLEVAAISMLSMAVMAGFFIAPLSTDTPEPLFMVCAFFIVFGLTHFMASINNLYHIKKLFKK